MGTRPDRPRWPAGHGSDHGSRAGGAAACTGNAEEDGGEGGTHYARWHTTDGERYLADTPHGQWEIGWQVDGWDPGPLGRLYRPKYFHSQWIAVHGYPEVPPYPASHGCVRVTITAMDWLWRTDQLPIGTSVWVY